MGNIDSAPESIENGDDDYDIDQHQLRCFGDVFDPLRSIVTSVNDTIEPPPSPAAKHRTASLPPLPSESDQPLDKPEFHSLPPDNEARTVDKRPQDDKENDVFIVTSSEPATPTPKTKRSRRSQSAPPSSEEFDVTSVRREPLGNATRDDMAVDSKRLQAVPESGVGVGTEPDAAALQTQKQSRSLFAAISESYDELVSAIIRPPRHLYELSDLGPHRFTYAGRKFTRTDLQLSNPMGQRLECSYWQQDLVNGQSKKRPCFVLLHGNSSSRIIAKSQLSYCLGLGASVFAFDFSGSGLSEGDFVTLGMNEVEDLRVVIDYLESSGTVNNLILWGRSMGAATALLYENEKSPLCTCLILDSPFASIEQLFEDFSKKMPGSVPSLLIDLVQWMLRNSIEDRAQLKIADISPINCSREASTPAMFIAGIHDNFVMPETHLIPLHAAYAGQKQIYLVDGDHNSMRPDALFYTILRFVRRYSAVTEPLSNTPSESVIVRVG